MTTKAGKTDKGFVLMLIGGPNDGARIRARVSLMDGDRPTWVVSGPPDQEGSYAAVYVARAAYPRKGWDMLHHVGKELPE